jgi:hypothetical protein
MTPLSLSRKRRFAAVEGLEARTLLAVTPAGPEFRVNSHTANSQIFPATAMDADGDFVVAWQSYGQDPNNGVYAQRYNAAGTAQGAEFLVPTGTAGNQTHPAVAMDASGDFVIAWESPDGSEAGVFARRFNAAGVAQGGEFRVNTYTTNTQWHPAVAMDANGDFIIAWESVGQDLVNTNGVYAQRYNGTGVAQGGEFRVNTQTAGNQWYPAAATDAAGNFVIAWESTLQDPDSSSGVYAQRYNAAGVAQGTEFRVNTYSQSVQGTPAVAMDTDGDFVISWTSNGQDSSVDGIYAQRFNAAGVSQGGEFRVNTTTTNQQRQSSVAMDADGDFVVTWHSYYQDPNAGLTGIYGQRFSAAGAPLDAEFRVNTTTANHQRYPAVAMDATGDFTVAWASYGQDTGDSAFQGGIYAQRYTLPRLLNVTQVFAGGSAWAAPFKNFLQSQSLGSSRFGYTIGGGAAQLVALPWNNVNQISISFSDDVQADQADLAVRGVNVASYPVTAFAYEPITHTGTWTLGRSLGNDNVLLDLDGDAANGVRAAGAGGQLLDGEWTTGGTYPSGNGTAGGDFRFRINVLPGDITRDAKVNALDLGDAKRRLNRAAGDGATGGGAFSAFTDVDASGRINALDLGAVKVRLNQVLPAAQPTSATAWLSPTLSLMSGSPARGLFGS